MAGFFGGLLGSYAAVGDGYELIASETLAVSAAAFTATSIPSGYKHLQIFTTTRMSSTTSGRLLMRVNGLSTSIYTNNDLLTFSSLTESGSSTTSQTYMDIGTIQLSTGTASIWSNSVIDLYNYSGSAGRKLFTSEFGHNNYLAYAGGQITLSSAITSVTLFASQSTMLAGSKISIYGIKG